MQQSEIRLQYAIHGIIAALLAALAGSLLFSIPVFMKFGQVAWAVFSLSFAMIFFLLALVIFPMMLLRKKISEPWYLITFMLIGFFGSQLLINLLIGNMPWEAQAWQSWIVVSYGITGLVCSLVAWGYLRYSHHAWLSTP